MINWSEFKNAKAEIDLVKLFQHQNPNAPHNCGAIYYLRDIMEMCPVTWHEVAALAVCTAEDMI